MFIKYYLCIIANLSIMNIRNLISAGVLAMIMSACSITAEVTPYDGALTQISFDKVTLQDDFWLPRLNTQKQVLVPFALEKTESAVENLRRVGAYLRGEKVTERFVGPYYVASDLFKVMEGAAYLLTLEKDEALEQQMDEIIDVIAAAQAPDGYLYEHHILPKHLRNPGNNAGERPYSYVDHSHELYNMGHMYEGAVAYYRATGKRKWLDVAEKSARHINKVFFEGDPAYNDGKPVMQAPGHEEIELALVKLYQATGEKLYLEMAKKFIDIRGVTYKPQGTGILSYDYAQQYQPVREQRKAIGHAVRATYLYSGMADVAAMMGDTTLVPALDAIWHDIVDKKMHITGGLGAVPGIEGFGPDYELPNKNTYDETCAAVGNVFFNYRMFLMSGDAKYVDVAEVALYNNVLAGVNLAGNRFFYVNPLETDGRKAFNHGTAGRAQWFGTACCPSNLARLIPQVSGMAYSYAEDNIFCGFYVGSEVEIPLTGGNVVLSQHTEYPFDGGVTIDVNPANNGEEFTLWLRIPTWCGDKFVPGDLYSYDDAVESNVVARVNGRKVRGEVVNGFLPVRRAWKAGDKVELELPMPVRFNIADERVEADRNRVCVTRGPLVYCAEEPDNEYMVSSYVLGDNSRTNSEIDEFTSGVMATIPTITLDASAVAEDGVVESAITLIPYYSWNNRGDNKAMNVWFARDAETAREGMVVTVGNIADVKASHTNSSDDVFAIADGKSPTKSQDTTIPRWTSWSQRGKEQWMEVKLKSVQDVEAVSVYWYDDAGGVQVPAAWSLEYMSDGKWVEFKPYVTDHFGTAADQYNMVHPAAPVKTDLLRLKMKPKANATVGILELTVE